MAIKIDQRIIAKALKDMQKDIRWLSKKYKEVQEKYGGMYVAIDKKKIVAANIDFGIVRSRVRKTPGDPTEPWIKYIPAKDEPEIIYL